MSSPAASAAERVFSLLELFEPIILELSIQDLITASHVSCAFLNNISSSKPLRNKILKWRNMSLNELVLEDTQGIPTGTVASRNFDYPYIRTKQAPWLFHTEYDDGVLITYRCSADQEYHLYLPLSEKESIYALRMAQLSLNHANYKFKVTWTSRVSGQVVLAKDYDGKLITYLMRMPRAPHEDPTHMYCYLQTWYSNANWHHWAESHLKLTPPTELSDRKTWFQWKVKGKGNAFYHRRMDVEQLSTKASPSIVSKDSTFKNRHGHIRDGAQTELNLNYQDSMITAYTKHRCHVVHRRCLPSLNATLEAIKDEQSKTNDSKQSRQV